VDRHQARARTADGSPCAKAVATLAERLIREEIERIKASIE
jgi:hypothetical protein